MIAIHSVLEHLIEQFDIVFQANVLAHFVEMLLAHSLAKLGIVQQQVGQLGALLHQVQLGHALRLALEFRGRNTHQFAQHIPGIVEGQGLVEVTGKKITL